MLASTMVNLTSSGGPGRPWAMIGCDREQRDAGLADARVRPPDRRAPARQVPIPEPGPGELRVRVQAIPFNLNDLERITGGNMMVRPELPYSPGHGGHGRRRRVRRRRRGVAGPARRRDAEGRERRLRRVRDLPGGVGVRHARGRSRCPARPRCTSRSISRGSGCSTAPSCRPGESVLIHAARRRLGLGRDPAREARGRACVRDRGHRREGAAVPRPRRRRRDQLQRRPTSREVVLAETGNRGVDVVFDNVGEAVMEKSLQCTAYNGRYLMMGFASNKLVADEPFIVPRRIALGNLKLCGVLLAYAAARWPRCSRRRWAGTSLGASWGADRRRDRRPRASRGHSTDRGCDRRLRPAPRGR